MSGFFDELCCVNGVWLSPRFPERHLTKLRAFPLHQQDVIVCGYPRSGNIWMMRTIACIMKYQSEPSSFVPMEFEKVFHKIESLHRPNVLMSHLRYDMLPEDVLRKGTKIIHLTRNLKDAAISWINFVKVQKNVLVKPSLDDYVKYCAEGLLSFGTWFDYMKDWLKHQDDPNILFIKYEDYVRDRRNTIIDVANFLGKKLQPGEVEVILNETSFDAMKAKDLENVDASLYDTKLGGHLRKGKIGDWKNDFTEEHNKVFDKLYQKFVHETGYTVSFD